MDSTLFSPNTVTWSCLDLSPSIQHHPDGTTSRPHKLRLSTKGTEQLVVDRDVSAAMALLTRLIGPLFKEGPEGSLVGFRYGAPKRGRPHPPDARGPLVMSQSPLSPPARLRRAHLDSRCLL
jgi:hypothetical protein